MRVTAPLRIRAIALLWGGLAASGAGDQLGMVALTWIAVDAFGRAAGYLSAAQALALLVSALVIGRWTDGRNERRVMIAADFARAAALAGVIVLWELTGYVSGLGLACLVVVLAFGQAAFRPAVQSIMPRLAPSADMIPATNALLDSTERLARLAGPALVALAAAWLPVVHFLTLDAGSFLVSAAALVLIGPVRGRFVQSRVRGGATVLRGFHAMRQHEPLGFLLKTSGIINGAWYAAMFLGVPLLLSQRGQPAGSGIRAFGAVVACYGLTNLVANLIVGSRPLSPAPARLIFAGTVLNGIGIALIGASGLLSTIGVAGIFMGAAIAGAGGPMSDIPRSTLMQAVLSADDIAPAFRAWIVSANAGMLLAMAAAPTMFAVTGSSAGIVICGCTIAVTGSVGLLRQSGTGTACPCSPTVVPPAGPP